MRIEDVIDESILAIFKDPILSKQMVLKGGSAIRMLDRDRSRLSLDADFSIQGHIRARKPYFSIVLIHTGYNHRDFLAVTREKAFLAPFAAMKS